MLPHAGTLDLRLADLEAQLDRLNSTLQQWRQSPEPHPAEQHLAQLAERCSDIVKQWAATSERHAVAVTELEAKLHDWNDVAARLQRDATWRFQDLERLIEHEWASLRRLHEEPVRQLRDQAESLTEICVSTAGSTQTGIERAEARLATLEKDLHRRMDDLARDVHAVLDEVRQRGAAPLGPPATPWALDEVTRLHHEIRDNAAVGKSATSSLAVRPVPRLTETPGDSPVVEVERISEAAEPIEHEPVPEAEVSDRRERNWMAPAAVAVAIAIAGGFSLMFYNRARLAADEAAAAQRHADVVANAANERIDAARRDATAQIDAARAAASRAQITSDVLAAPDLVRFNLVGVDGPAHGYAQVLMSRSRGLVFSATRLPPAASGSVYQLWLLTPTDPVSAGTIAPDESGRITFATDRPPDVPRPIVGVRVTLESSPGGQTPSDQTVLSRAQ